jgi:hypothetical protein
MPDIVFKRTGAVIQVPDKSDPTKVERLVVGELRIGSQTWTTIEKGGAPWVRKGTYTLQMGYKKQGNSQRRRSDGSIPWNREALRFKDSWAIQTFMIHDFRGDIAGCIAPVYSAETAGVTGSEDAMKEVIAALGSFTDGKEVKIEVENNVPGSKGAKAQTKEQWINDRKDAAKAKAKP